VENGASWATLAQLAMVLPVNRSADIERVERGFRGPKGVDSMLFCLDMIFEHASRVCGASLANTRCGARK
jgi:hypothetical protein